MAGSGQAGSVLERWCTEAGEPTAVVPPGPRQATRTVRGAMRDPSFLFRFADVAPVE
jgi:hypothetical protein